MTAVFAAGLWIGGMSGGQLRAALAEYLMEFGPGPMIGSSPADPSLPKYKVYSLHRAYVDPAERDRDGVWLCGRNWSIFRVLPSEESGWA